MRESKLKKSEKASLRAREMGEISLRREISIEKDRDRERESERERERERHPEIVVVITAPENNYYGFRNEKLS